MMELRPQTLSLTSLFVCALSGWVCYISQQVRNAYQAQDPEGSSLGKCCRNPPEGAKQKAQKSAWKTAYMKQVAMT